MKKLILVLIFSILFISNTYSQSGWVNTFFNNTYAFSKIVKRDSLNYLAFCSYGKNFYKSTDAGNSWYCYKEFSIDSNVHIFDGQFVNSQTGWISGQTSESSRGFISKTTNGGLNWIYVNTGIENWNCKCVSFINENTGWVGSHLGITGRLLKTTNGGLNWSVQNLQGVYEINSMKFLDINNGWISTYDSAIYRTSNGGLNWIRKPIDIIQPANYFITLQICPLNNNEVWVLAYRFQLGYSFSNIYKTTDGGSNWVLTYSYTDSLQTNSNNFFKLNFINSSTGFAGGGYNFLVRTTNGGISWDKATLKILDLLPINSNELFASGEYGTHNSIFKSSNLGMNWTLINHNWPIKFIKTKFLDINTGYIIADTGRIYKTTNNGANWNLIYYNTNYFFQDISFANSSTGCIIIYNPPNFSQKILRTTNSGNNWYEIYNSQHYQNKNGLLFIDQLNGFAGSDSSRLLKTTNSGLNWNLISLSNSVFCDFVDFSFINGSTGWVSGHKASDYPFNYNRNIIWKTTNSGNNWDMIYDSTESNNINNYLIYFTDNNFGYRFLYNYFGNVQITTNSGTNWINYSFPGIYSPQSIKFINKNTGWISGDGGNYNKVLKTTNGGINWILQFNGNGYLATCLDAYDTDHAWFCGYYSDLYKTTDGGGNLEIRKIGSNTLPSSSSLSQNYPNPFNPTTSIKYQIKKLSSPHALSGELVQLKIYDILGKEIETLVNEKQSPGTYEVNWDGSIYPSGVYFYKLSTGDFTETKKMVLLK